LAFSRTEIRALTSLRGVAALAVVIYHFRREFGAAIDLDAYTSFFASGYLWVDFFFVLSGFVMAYVYGGEFADNLQFSGYRTFLLRRLGRIYPLHVFMLLCFIPTEAVKFMVHTSANPPFSVNSPDTILANLLLIQAWGIYDHYTWNTPSWSISTEWFAYLVFPAIALFAWRLRRLLGLLSAVGICIAGLFVVEIISGTGNINFGVSGLMLLRCLFSFAMGVTVYRFFGTGSSSVKAAVGSDASLAASLLAVVFAMHTRADDLAVIAIFVWIVASASLNEGNVRAFLSLRPLYFLGTISYSIYLTHAFVMRVWQAAFEVVWHGVIVTSEAYIIMVALVFVVIGVSTLTYRFVEQPGRKYFARLAGQLAREHAD
jgi:peptidoglycan/LPS O-acetylase OafA/YrhL